MLELLPDVDAEGGDGGEFAEDSADRVAVAAGDLCQTQRPPILHHQPTCGVEDDVVRVAEFTQDDGHDLREQRRRRNDGVAVDVDLVRGFGAAFDSSAG